MSTQMMSQAWGVLIAIVWSGIASFVAFKIADIMVGLRVEEATERQGLDVIEHGESAYNL
jgi:Amt family ammonium transporter